MAHLNCSLQNLAVFLERLSNNVLQNNKSRMHNPYMCSFVTISTRDSNTKVDKVGDHMARN